MFGNIKMKRTTSMTGIAVDDNLNEPPQRDQGGIWNESSINGQDQFINGFGPMLLSPRYATSDHHVGLLQAEAESTVVADFLRTCGLCQRRLVPGRDIYMYRGDTAFCSQECREEQMKQDERKERRKLAAQRHLSPATAPPTGTTTEDHYVAATLHY